MEHNGKGNQGRRLDGDKSEVYWEEEDQDERMEEVGRWRSWEDGGGEKMEEVRGWRRWEGGIGAGFLLLLLWLLLLLLSCSEQGEQVLTAAAGSRQRPRQPSPNHLDLGGE